LAIGQINIFHLWPVTSCRRPICPLLIFSFPPSHDKEKNAQLRVARKRLLLRGLQMSTIFSD
jgi:hypothetical protein